MLHPAGKASEFGDPTLKLRRCNKAGSDNYWTFYPERLETRKARHIGLRPKP